MQFLFFNSHGLIEGKLNINIFKRGFSVNFNLKLSRKAGFALIAILSLVGLGGVTAASDITLNSNNPLKLGAGEAGTTTCDSDISISGFASGTSNVATYRYESFSLTNIDLGPATAAGTGCGGQVMRLMVKNSNGTMEQASWNLPQSIYTTFNFTFGTTNLGALSGLNGLSGVAGNKTTYNATIALTSILRNDLSGVAVAISNY